MDHAIIMEGVRKNFDGSEVLRGVDFRVRKNEVVSIIGPSGAGKTTLLRIAAGLEKPSGGKVEVDGRIGMVFQHCHLWPHKTVLENVTEPLVSAGKLGRDDALAKARGILENLGLAQKMNSFPDTLSGGETQRVAIARTLAMDPEIILLDEITSALDPERARDVIEALKALVRERKTIVIVTHRMDFAKEVSDKVVVLDAGRVVEAGHPYRIFTAPENARTKELVYQKV